jgi:molecular chaperone IbpA
MTKYNSDNPFADLFNLALPDETRVHNYPPYNLYYDKNNSVVEVALAGFKKEDIIVEIEPKVNRLKQRNLVIKANKSNSVKSNVEYRVKGIAMRNFKLSFNLDDEAEIKEARFEDGLLTIVVSTDVKVTGTDPILVPIS